MLWCKKTASQAKKTQYIGSWQPLTLATPPPPPPHTPPETAKTPKNNKTAKKHLKLKFFLDQPVNPSTALVMGV